MPAKIGYAAMLEQFAPREMVELCVAAEQAGFEGVMAADHLQPWVPQQGQSAFVWSFMAAAAERTRGDVGPGVTCPSFRMHPVMVAQAAATMSAMYPDRFWLGLGSGEALNEHVIAGYWPEAVERTNRMFEAVEIIQRLLTGKQVRHEGRFFKMESIRLWTLPQRPPPIYIATAGPLTAHRTGMIADGLITVGAPVEKVAGILERCREGCREVGNDCDRFRYTLQLHLSWAATDEEAMRNAITEWPNGGMKFPKQDIRSPHDFEQMAKMVNPEDFQGRMVISSDPEAHRKEIQKFLDLGFHQIYLHNVGRNQREWIEAFGREVLPALRG
ncbi:MAG TPA: TIGR03557 family F420-dependent LLM class oxidoreductase [Candidatus Binatia bacterium]|nr:TIGR03557 family F420-dependent LLM class oxidoreductase [Candidatus Binatia bacterium]